MKPKSSIPDERDFVTTVRLSVGQHRRLKQIAEHEQRTVSQQVRFILDRWIAEQEREQVAA